MLCVIVLRVQTAAGLALACYLLIGAGVLVLGPAWAAAWLLRLPAAATVGVIALIALVSSSWGLSAPYAGMAAVIVLATAACGYLAVEVRNHGVAGRELTRVLGVAGIGAAHALMVSLLGLVYVAPAFGSNGRRLARLCTRPGTGTPEWSCCWPPPGVSRSACFLRCCGTTGRSRRRSPTSSGAQRGRRRHTCACKAQIDVEGTEMEGTWAVGCSGWIAVMT